VRSPSCTREPERDAKQQGTRLPVEIDSTLPNRFISSKQFTRQYTGDRAAMHYLYTVFLPRAKEFAAHGTAMVEVYRYNATSIDPENVWQNAKVDHMARLNRLLKEAGWQTQTNSSASVTDGRMTNHEMVLWAIIEPASKPATEPEMAASCCDYPGHPSKACGHT
jgi:hypothetical protein